jgi:hypothetical protein
VYGTVVQAEGGVDIGCDPRKEKALGVTTWAVVGCRLGWLQMREKEKERP